MHALHTITPHLSNQLVRIDLNRLNLHCSSLQVCCGAKLFWQLELLLQLTLFNSKNPPVEVLGILRNTWSPISTKYSDQMHYTKYDLPTPISYKQNCHFLMFHLIVQNNLNIWQKLVSVYLISIYYIVDMCVCSEGTIIQALTSSSLLCHHRTNIRVCSLCAKKPKNPLTEFKV